MAESKRKENESEYNYEIDLMHIFRVAWEGKWLIILFVVMGAVVAVGIALSLPNIYRAEALLAPNQEKPGGDLAKFGGLASLAGIDIGGDSSNKSTIGLEVLKSRKFISQFIERHDILVPLMAAEGWDWETRKIRIDPDNYDETSKRWVRKVRPPKAQIPSLQEAANEFKRILSVRQDKKTNLVTISVEHYDPSMAKQWVDWLVHDINEAVLKQDVSKAEQAIAYLNKQIQSTAVAELQKVFFGLIEEQTKTIMLAKVSPEYLLITVDPAVVPERKAKPKRAFILLLGIFIGATLGLIIAFYRYSGKRTA